MRLTHRAPSPCPDEQAFIREVRARTPLAEFANAPARARSFHVVIVEQEGEYLGQLTIVDEQRTSEREFKGEHCDEISTALALLTALTIDPDAQSGPVIPLPVERPAPPPLTSTVPAPEPNPVRPVRSEPTVSSQAWALSAGVHLFLHGWVTPNGALGADVFGEVRAPHDGLVSPAFRLELGYSRSEILEDANAEWTWTVARVQACPLQLRLSEEWENQPCAAVEGGIVYGRGIDVAHPDDASRLWMAWGLTNGLIWRHGAALVELRAAVWAPSTRYQFVFRDPRIEVHEIPALTASVAIGGGLRFY